jgi:hypothetical protein
MIQISLWWWRCFLVSNVMHIKECNGAQPWDTRSIQENAQVEEEKSTKASLKLINKRAKAVQVKREKRT